MQRQPLGSPSSKLVKDEQLSCETQNLSSGSSMYGEERKEEEEKELKKPKAKAAIPERYIHVIPMLSLLCFLILYLSSHDLSQNDLAQFNGHKTSSNPADSEENISELQQVVHIKKGSILVIRSLKQEHRRHHRKFAHF